MVVLFSCPYSSFLLKLLCFRAFFHQIFWVDPAIQKWCNGSNSVFTYFRTYCWRPCLTLWNLMGCLPLLWTAKDIKHLGDGCILYFESTALEDLPSKGWYFGVIVAVRSSKVKIWSCFKLCSIWETLMGKPWWQCFWRVSFTIYHIRFK